ncbi:hypothetical protein Asppvi_005175 [Aspergillus pseudoviridinutans]|uniref:Uncharacterized protein n=1 Tax=Aspergillus pseudoviridinutans TaxID=1517512 RepID=A0A9P3ESK4_9EURO|nr:uncharacterized protein Asppvi_005175 [Aspergillus pseudoviridinutans]GIJ86289.1 hypothetical protein Asppvi_005175 [Aspergillus pseudoviridinutans]
MSSDEKKDQQLSDNDGFTTFAKEDPSAKNKKNQDSNLKITIHLDLVAEVDIKIKAQLYGDIVIGLL